MGYHIAITVCTDTQCFALRGGYHSLQLSSRWTVALFEIRQSSGEIVKSFCTYAYQREPCVLEPYKRIFAILLNSFFWFGIWISKFFSRGIRSRFHVPHSSICDVITHPNLKCDGILNKLLGQLGHRFVSHPVITHWCNQLSIHCYHNIPDDGSILMIETRLLGVKKQEHHGL